MRDVRNEMLFQLRKDRKNDGRQYLASTGYDEQRQASFDHGIFNGISNASSEKAY
jgi:hypothetical protein